MALDKTKTHDVTIQWGQVAAARWNCPSCHGTMMTPSGDLLVKLRDGKGPESKCGCGLNMRLHAPMVVTH